MRNALVIVALVGLLGCDDDTSDDKANSEPDSGSPDSGRNTGSQLEEPGVPRPPTDGLPDDLRPPRD